MRNKNKFIILMIFTINLNLASCSNSESDALVSPNLTQNSTTPSDESQTDLAKFEFAATKGQMVDPDPNAKGSGPWATSLNLLHVDEKGKVITDSWITDQAGVPNLLVDKLGNIYLYFQSWAQGNVIAVAKSSDQMQSWDFYKVQVSGFDIARGPNGVDPSAIELSDGRIRLFWMQSLVQNASEIFSATSELNNGNGIIFNSDDGARFTPNKLVFDPTIVQVDENSYYLWADAAGKPLFAKSSDGLNFEAQIDPLGSQEYFPWSAYTSPSGAEMYVTNKKGAQARIAIEVKENSNEIGTSELDKSFIPKTKLHDMSVLKLSDGSFLIAYLKPM